MMGTELLRMNVHRIAKFNVVMVLGMAKKNVMMEMKLLVMDALQNAFLSVETERLTKTRTVMMEIGFQKMAAMTFANGNAEMVN